MRINLYTRDTARFHLVVDRYGRRINIYFKPKGTRFSMSFGVFGYNFGMLLQRNGTSYDFVISLFLIYFSCTLFFKNLKNVTKTKETKS